MKPLLHLALFLLIIQSCSKNITGTAHTTNTTATYDFKDYMTQEQVSFLKDAYPWDKQNLLIINYRQPINYCHFDNHKITNQSKKWWANFYSKIATENCTTIHVYASGKLVKSQLDGLAYFDDRVDFLFKNFFTRLQSCFGLMVVREDGHYIQFNGHYSENQINKFVDY